MTGFENGAERCVRLYAEDAETIEPRDNLKGKHVNLNLESYGQKEFNIEIEKDTKIGLLLNILQRNLIRS